MIEGQWYKCIHFPNSVFRFLMKNGIEYWFDDWVNYDSKNEYVIIWTDKSTDFQIVKNYEKEQNASN